MMASAATCEGESQKMEEDADKDGSLLKQPDTCLGEDASGIHPLKKDNCVVSSDSHHSVNSGGSPDEGSVSSRANDVDEEMKEDVSQFTVDLNSAQWKNDLAEKSPDSAEQISDSKEDIVIADKSEVSCERDMDTSDSDKVSEGFLMDKHNHVSSDGDELYRLDTEIEMIQPVNVKSRAIFIDTVTNSSGNSGLTGNKRNTNDDGESPQPKRPTPERAENETAENNDPSQPEPTSEELPDLSSDSDDDSDDSNVGAPRRKRLLRRKFLRKRLDRQSFSSDDSDTTLDDDDNEENVDKNTDDEDKTESDEVRIAVEATLGKPTPKPNWFAVPELRRREYGCRSGCFMEKVQGSLSMVQRLVRVERMKAHEGCVNALSFNRIGTLLASGSDDLNIVLWNWQRARPSLIYDSGHRSNVFQAKFMPFSGDCHVISCARDGQVRLAELSLTGVCKATRKLAQHRGAVHKLALELDSPNIFLSCGEDALTYLFDLRQEKPHKLVITKENEKKVPLYSIHSNPCDPRQFCVGGRDHYVRVYDKRKINEEIDGGVLKRFCPDHLVNSEIKANITCACYNYNGTEILATYNDEDIYLFDNTMSDGANYTHKYTGHRNNATAKNVNFYGPKSEFIVSGSDCGYIYFWDKETEAIINFQEGDDAGVVNVLEPHPTLPFLATSGLDHDVKLWMPYEPDPEICLDELRKTVKKNFSDRCQERKYSEPEMIGGQMLWFIMHHFRNSARRRMREEGQVLSSSDDDNSSRSDDSDTNSMQCAQS
ncbi:DDB1- and CUL4-associated factor 8 [Bulinus truncatus]|nr:DDB1- and CUL4-associated factor 8 [Bulinus truncatus]